MASVTFELADLPWISGSGFRFTLERTDLDAATTTLTIPIVQRGPESYAESQDQEQWVQGNWPDLEMAFAGAWLIHTPQQLQRVVDYLESHSPGPTFAAQMLLQQLRYGSRPPSPCAPNGLPAYHQNADVDDATRDLARAEDLLQFDALIALAPTWHWAWLARARRRSTEHADPLAALDDTRQACNLAPESAETWSELGSELWAMERLEDALEALLRAIACPDATAANRTQVAGLLATLGRHTEALAQLAVVLRTLMRQDYSYYSVQLDRAKSLGAMGKIDQALADYREAAQVQPSEASPWIQSVQLLRTVPGREKEAATLAVKAAKLAKDWEIALLAP